MVITAQPTTGVITIALVAFDRKYSDKPEVAKELNCTGEPPGLERWLRAPDDAGRRSMSIAELFWGPDDPEDYEEL